VVSGKKSLRVEQGHLTADDTCSRALRGHLDMTQERPAAKRKDSWTACLASCLGVSPGR
jgi:hypothetical protein